MNVDAVLPAVVWHGSRADIDRPTLAGRTEGENHANSGLGLFCATAPDPYITNFGPVVFALTLAASPRVLFWTVAELRRQSGRSGTEEPARAWFECEGRRLAAVYDVIALRETDGTIRQVIVLADAAIASVEKLSAAEFQRRFPEAEPLTRGARRP